VISIEDKKDIARMVAEEVMRRLKTILNQPVPTERLLTIDELSHLIGYSKKTIYNWIHEERIPYQKDVTGRVRFRYNKVIGWLKKRECRGRRTRKV